MYNQNGSSGFPPLIVQPMWHVTIGASVAAQRFLVQLERALAGFLTECTRRRCC